MPALPRWIRTFACLGLLAVAATVACHDPSPEGRSTAEIYAEIEPTLAEWQETRRREVTLRTEEWSNQFRAARPRVPGEREQLQRDLDELVTRRYELRGQLADGLLRLRGINRTAPETLRMESEFLAVLFADTAALLQDWQRQQEHVELLGSSIGTTRAADDGRTGDLGRLAAEQRREWALLQTIEEDLAREFTWLQAHFPRDRRVNELEDEVVVPHYRELRQNDPQIADPALPTGDPNTAELTEGEWLAYLATALDEMKRRYPHSHWTRKAEQYVITESAQRHQRGLAGWPLLTLLILATFLVFGYVRCMTSYLRFRSVDEPDGSRIIRPVSWVDAHGRTTGSLRPTQDATPLPPVRLPESHAIRGGIYPAQGGPRVGAATPAMPRRGKFGDDETPASGRRPPVVLGTSRPDAETRDDNAAVDPPVAHDDDDGREPK